MGTLDGKIALVTGGSMGIGLASARRLIAEGAHVFITGRRAAELEGAARELRDNVSAVVADVAKLADLDRLYETVRDAGGNLDIVVANAGVSEAVPLTEITEAHVDRLFDINVKGTLFTVQKALPLLRDSGAIVITGSIAGSKGFPSYSVYNATKAALRSFARSWTVELAPRRIRVNVISPGPIDTPGVRKLQDGDGGAFQREFLAKTPLGRFGTSDEVARVIAFLASDDASYIAGAEIFADGGFAQV
jgi:NAD(P)-dependent dehydrogenase (short-subunit alcohol dehydrogenase family)